MTFEPPLTPPNGALAVSPADMRTDSSPTPNVSAAIVASAFSTPLMSATAVTIVSLPSESRRQIAAAGSRPPGQNPSARPTPSPSGSSSRPAHSGCSRSASRHSRAPKLSIAWPSSPVSPGWTTFDSRSSTGSSSSCAASSSISVSIANAAGGAPGAR